MQLPLFLFLLSLLAEWSVALDPRLAEVACPKTCSKTTTKTTTDEITKTKTVTTRHTVVATSTVTKTSTESCTTSSTSTSSGTCTPTAQVVQNPGFESGTQSPWVFSTDGKSIFSVSSDSSNAHSGQYYGKTSIGDGQVYTTSAWNLTQQISTCPGVGHTAVIYSQCDLTFGGSCRLKLCASGHCNVFFPQGGQFSGEGPGFHRNTVSFTGNAQGTTLVSVGVDGVDATCDASVVRVDDITVNVGDGTGA